MAIGQYSTGHNRVVIWILWLLYLVFSYGVPEYWTHSAKDVRANQALSILVWALLWIWYVFKSEFRLIIARTSLIGAYCGFIRFRCRSSNEEASNKLMSAFFAGLAFAVEFFGSSYRKWSESRKRKERIKKKKQSIKDRTQQLEHDLQAAQSRIEDLEIEVAILQIRRELPLVIIVMLLFMIVWILCYKL